MKGFGGESKSHYGDATLSSSKIKMVFNNLNVMLTIGSSRIDVTLAKLVWVVRSFLLKTGGVRLSIC